MALDKSQVRRIKQRLNATNMRLSEELTRDLFENAILPATLSWFGTNSSVKALETDIRRSIEGRWPIIQVKIETALTDFEEQTRVQLKSFESNSAVALDVNAIIASLNERVGQVVAVIGTSFVAIVCGGSGVALLATGPLGIIIGAIVGAAVYLGNKDSVEEWVSQNLLNKSVPVFAKSLIKSKVSAELKRTEGPFQQRLFELLQEQTRLIAEALDVDTE